MKKSARRRIDVNLDELDRVLDGARQAPLSEDDYEKLKEALHALAAMLVRPRNTEKTSAVLGKSEGEPGAGTDSESNASPSPGHGRNGAAAFVSSRKIAIAHAKLKHGDRCWYGSEFLMSASDRIKRRALNSAVECHPHTVEVVGSNPTAPTIFSSTYRSHMPLSASPATLPVATVISSVTMSP